MSPPKPDPFKQEDVDEVGAAIRLLIGAGNESFELERELRLFQFKAWLLGFPGRYSFPRSALLFATILVTARHRKFSLLTSSEAIVLAMMSRELRPLIDYAFNKHKLPLYQLTQIWFHPYKEAHRKKPLEGISVLNALTRFRLRLHFTKRMTPSINNGLALLSSAEVDTKAGRTSAKALRQRMRVQEAFLYAAQNYPEMMFLPPKPAEIFGALKREMRETERINEYFALSKSLMKILDEDAAQAFERYWGNLPLVDIPPLQPVSEEEMDEAGIGPRYRRSAKVTKLAKLQAPTGSK
jgi:hypothetical protein